MDVEEFSAELTRFKKSYNFTMNELSNLLCGVPIRTLEDWIAGRRTPPEYIMKLTIAYLQDQMYEWSKHPGMKNVWKDEEE